MKEYKTAEIYVAELTKYLNEQAKDYWEVVSIFPSNTTHLTNASVQDVIVVMSRVIQGDRRSKGRM